jgi:hypothetical protein
LARKPVQARACFPPSAQVKWLAERWEEWYSQAQPPDLVARLAFLARAEEQAFQEALAAEASLAARQACSAAA